MKIILKAYVNYYLFETQVSQDNILNIYRNNWYASKIFSSKAFSCLVHRLKKPTRNYDWCLEVAFNHLCLVPFDGVFFSKATVLLVYFNVIKSQWSSKVCRYKLNLPTLPTYLNERLVPTNCRIDIDWLSLVPTNCLSSIYYICFLWNLYDSHFF